MPTYCGQKLKEALANVSPERQPIIENFLYEKSALLLFADDGVGKSVLCLQACLQATITGAKVFGEFGVPTGRNVLYFQLERDPDESFERMKYLQAVIPFEDGKFALSTDLQGTDLQDVEMRAKAMKTVDGVIGEIGFTPEVVAFDPIYAMVSEDLSTASACNAVTSFFRVVQAATRCSILATSHTNRGVRDKETHQRVGKDMYGNRFLSAFFTGSYQINSINDGAGSRFKLEKNSQKNLEKKFELDFDPATYFSWFKKDGEISKKNKLERYLSACKASKNTFTFDDLTANSQLSPSHVRIALSGHLKSDINVIDKLHHGKHLYQFK